MRMTQELGELERALVRVLSDHPDSVVPLARLRHALEQSMPLRIPPDGALLNRIAARPDLFLLLEPEAGVPGIEAWPVHARGEYGGAIPDDVLHAEPHVALRARAPGESYLAAGRSLYGCRSNGSGHVPLDDARPYGTRDGAGKSQEPGRGAYEVLGELQRSVVRVWSVREQRLPITGVADAVRVFAVVRGALGARVYDGESSHCGPVVPSHRRSVVPTSAEVPARSENCENCGAVVLTSAARAIKAGKRGKGRSTTRPPGPPEPA